MVLLDRAWEFNGAQPNLGSIFVPDKIVFDALEWQCPFVQLAFPHPVAAAADFFADIRTSRPGSHR